MKKRTKMFFIAVVLMMTAGLVFGADIYVSAETGLAVRSADGSKAKPYKDLQAALDKAAALDTIYIAEGNYLGTSDRGFLEMLTPVNLKGGYSKDFSSRDVIKYKTMIQPPASVNKTAQGMASLSLGKAAFKVPDPGITIDGIIFDRGFSNGYHPTKGKPEGVETGMFVHAPGSGMNKDAPSDVFSIKKCLLYFNTGSTGNVTVQNCVFANSGFYGILGGWQNGKITIRNNVFVANLYAAVEIPGATGQSKDAYMTQIDFSYNTVLFTWTRVNDLKDMGYGYRYMTGANTDVTNCLIGLNAFAGLDRTRVDTTPADAAKRKTGAENNAFFLNRKGDLYIASGGGQMLTIWAKNFEDREELYKYEKNIELSGDKLKGKLNEAYLKGFLSMVYSEKMDYDPNSSANQFRKAYGMNQVATVTTQVDMYGNRYPLEDALKLFGAVQGYGAQAIKN